MTLRAIIILCVIIPVGGSEILSASGAVWIDFTDVEQRGRQRDERISVVLPIPARDSADSKFIQEMGFVRIPRGTFWSGGGSYCEINNDPKKSGWKFKWPTQMATINADFELAAFLVTHSQWEALMDNNPSCFSTKGQLKDWVKGVDKAELRQFPIEDVSWDDIQVFLKKLNGREAGKGWKYRLPTEAEWEYACRGAAATKEECAFDFYFAKPTNDLSSDQANFFGKHPAGKAPKGKFLKRPSKVGSYKPNKLGLFDMHGNMIQWCDDFWDATSPEHVVRGGSFASVGLDCRASNRNSFPPSHRSCDVGFRIARIAVR